MSRSQWWRHQRVRKVQQELEEKEVGDSSSNQLPSTIMVEEKQRVGRRLFSPKKEEIVEKDQKDPVADEDIMIDDFESNGESYLEINYDMVSVLPHEYDQITKVEES